MILLVIFDFLCGGPALYKYLVPTFMSFCPSSTAFSLVTADTTLLTPRVLTKGNNDIPSQPDPLHTTGRVVDSARSRCTLIGHLP